MTLAYPDSPYGISRELNFTANYLLETSIVTAAAALPVSWIRIQINWQHIEPTLQSPPQYLLTLAQGVAVDESIQRINAAGLNAYFTVTSPPTFRRSQSWGGGFNYASAQEMHDFVVMLATRYKTGSSNGVLSCIDIGNEDYSVSNDAYHHGYWLAQAMELCYPAVKAIDPNMLVGMGAQLQCGVNFVPAFQAEIYSGNPSLGIAGIGANADYSNTHYYRGNKKDPTNNQYTGTNTIAAQINAMHTADSNGGFPQRDVRITEYGWAAVANPGPNSSNITYAQQSQYILDVVDAARTSGVVSHISVYTMDYPDLNSIIQSGPTYLQAYTDLQAYIAQYPQWGTGLSSTLNVSPTSVGFSATTGTNPPNQQVTLTNTGQIAGSYTSAITYSGNSNFSSGINWLSISPTGGTLQPSQQQTVTVMVASSTLAAGVYQATITWTMGTNTATCTVTLTVTGTGSNLSASPTTLLYTGVAGGTNPASQKVTLTNSSGTTQSWSSSIQYGSGSGWLSLTPSSGSIPGSGGTVQVTCAVSNTGLAAGTYTATVTWTMGTNTATTAVTLFLGLVGTLKLFSPITVISSADMNANFNALNTIPTLPIPFITFSSDNNLIQSDGNGNLIWSGGIGHSAFTELYDGRGSTVTLSNITPTGTIHFQVPSGTDIATINSTEWTLHTGGISLSTGSLSRTSTFTGTGSGTYNHGNGGTPNVVMPVCDVLGFERVEYDSPGSSQVNINVDGGLGFWCFCEGF